MRANSAKVRHAEPSESKAPTERLIPRCFPFGVCCPVSVVRVNHLQIRVPNESKGLNDHKTALLYFLKQSTNQNIFLLVYQVILQS